MDESCALSIKAPFYSEEYARETTTRFLPSYLTYPPFLPQPILINRYSTRLSRSVITSRTGSFPRSFICTTGRLNRRVTSLYLVPDLPSSLFPLLHRFLRLVLIPARFQLVFLSVLLVLGRGRKQCSIYYLTCTQKIIVCITLAKSQAPHRSVRKWTCDCPTILELCISD